MNICLIKPENPLLRNYIQYFLFLKSGTKEVIRYTTFPNNNLCLAVYKNSRVEYKNTDGVNNCNISYANNHFVSRLYGFHERPFRVTVQSPLDQICVLFRPAALRFFTGESYESLLTDGDVFDHIFHSGQSGFLEILYAEESLIQRVRLLESKLLKTLNSGKLRHRMKAALSLISATSESSLTVKKIAGMVEVNESTLYRLFKNNLGQNPKTYLKTIRFRRALNEITGNCQNNFTQLAHDHHFFDQSHFIKDFKAFAGHTPKELSKLISVEKKELVWLHQ